jgi:exopolysaccharide production protein ExoY
MPLRQDTPAQAKSKISSGRSDTRRRPVQPPVGRRIVVVGAPGDVPRALEHPAVGGRDATGATILAIDIDSPDGMQGMERLAELLRSHRTEAILVAGPIGAATMRHLSDLALIHGCRVLAVMPTEVLPEHDPVIVWSEHAPLVQLSPIPRRRIEPRLKRIIDVALAGVGLLVTAPFIGVIAGLVCLESPGAPIFRHARVGRNGKTFSCLKIRTMRADAEDCLKTDPALYDAYRLNHFKIPEDRDPRVTRLGRILRKASLDELPQLWNVLVGEMSLVGPRPVVEEELAMYGASAALLLSVRPGLTGAWAVNGRHEVGYPDRCTLELDYVRRWSLRQDAAIAVRTAAVLARPR